MLPERLGRSLVIPDTPKSSTLIADPFTKGRDMETNMPARTLLDLTPEEAAIRMHADCGVTAVAMCAVAVKEAEGSDDDVALYYWLRVTREVVKRLIAEREELGG